MRGYRELKAWRQGMKMVRAVYDVASELPDDERYELSSQLRRAAVSVPANIAEGYGNNTRGRYLDRVRTARGSIAELETHLELIEEIDSISTTVPESLWRRLARVSRLHAFPPRASLLATNFTIRSVAFVQHLATDEAGFYGLRLNESRQFCELC